MKPLAIIAGAGPGLGQALLARFEVGGFMPVGLGRTQAENFIGEFHEIDLSKENDVDDTISAVIQNYGAPQVVIHNVAELIIKPFEDAHISDYEKTWSSMVRSAVLVARATLKPMVRAGGGSFLVSGATASLRGGANFSAFASAKFALRGLTQSLAREFQPSGVHVCHFILDGIIDTQRSRDLHSLDPSKMMAPADIAEAYWQVAHQPQSTWTHELDLRPATEKF